MTIQYLDSDEKFTVYLKTIKADIIETLALDIEGEFNLHQYGEKLCLIQVFDGRRKIVIDPFSVSGENIRQFFSKKDLKKIMYDSSSDQKLILKQYGVRISAITDLRPAAELLDLPRKDLASVIELYLGIRKTRNYQRYDWTRRPVDPGALEYAMNDVIYLFDLQKNLFREVENSGLMGEYRHRNELVNTRKIDLNRDPGFFRKTAFLKLEYGEKKRVRKIFYIRDKYAKQYNVPPHHIISNRDIIPIGIGRADVGHARFYHRMTTPDSERIRSEIAKVLKQE